MNERTPIQKEAPTRLESLKRFFERLSSHNQRTVVQIQIAEGLWNDTTAYEPKFTQSPDGQVATIRLFITKEDGTPQLLESTNGEQFTIPGSKESVRVVFPEIA